MCGGGVYQLGVELFGGAASVHSHECLLGGRHAVVVEVELSLTLDLRAQAPLGAAGDQASLVGVHLLFRDPQNAS